MFLLCFYYVFYYPDMTQPWARGGWEAMARAQSDFSYNCPQRAVADAVARHTRTWFFWFEHVTEDWAGRSKLIPEQNAQEGKHYCTNKKSR